MPGERKRHFRGARARILRVLVIVLVLWLGWYLWNCSRGREMAGTYLVDAGCAA